MGADYAKILDEMSEDIRLERDLERIFKPSANDEATNRGELAMKRLAKGTTTSGEPRNLALKIQKRTGIDLIKTARLGQLSMDIVGDTRGGELYGLIGNLTEATKKGFIDGTVDVAKKLVADKEKAARANTILSNGGKASGKTPIKAFGKNYSAYYHK